MIIKIIYEDDFLMVISKPKGLNVHKNTYSEKRNLIKILSSVFKKKLRLVNRIDKYTSGLLLISKLKKFQFRNFFLKKIYLVSVFGKWPLNFGIIDLPLTKKYIYRRNFTFVNIYGKKALTKILKTKYINNKISILEIETFSGRTHQIRSHLSYLGYPIIGDTLYGNYNLNKKNFLQLHCEEISFFHPFLLKKIKVYSNGRTKEKKNNI